jgi:hypothetical protein
MATDIEAGRLRDSLPDVITRQRWSCVVSANLSGIAKNPNLRRLSDRALAAGRSVQDRPASGETGLMESGIDIHSLEDARLLWYTKPID